MQIRYPSIHVYRISLWPHDEYGLQPFIKLTGNRLFPYGTTFPTYFLIDEAQATYNKAELWTAFKNIVVADNVWVVLFCSYGSSKSKIDDFVTPDKFAAAQMLGLWGSPNAGPGLLYNRAEFDEVVTRSKVLLPPEVTSAIFHLSAGHAGAVHFLLKSIKRKVCCDCRLHSCAHINTRTTLP
jgi:hypothetical protein